MKYFLKNFDFAEPSFGDYILYLDLNSSDEVNEFERKLAELRPSCLNASTIIKFNDKMFITFVTREKRLEFFNEFVKRGDGAFEEPYYLEFTDNKENEIRPINANYFIEFLKGMYKRAGWDDKDIHMSLKDVISNLDNIPTITDSCQWTPVTDKLPVLTDDEDNEFLVTMRTIQSTKKFSLYYVCMAKYSENLHELSSDDFPEEKRSGWYNYDAEGGYFYDMEFTLDKYKKEVVAWMPLPKPYEEKK